MKIDIVGIHSADTESPDYAVGASAGNDRGMQAVHLGHAYSEGVFGIKDTQEVTIGHGQDASVCHDTVYIEGYCLDLPESLFCKNHDMTRTLLRCCS